ncbi:MAG: hypothetical protein AAF674_05370 [Pseudomonadota bacterium]
MSKYETAQTNSLVEQLGLDLIDIETVKTTGLENILGDSVPGGDIPEGLDPTGGMPGMGTTGGTPGIPGPDGQTIPGSGTQGAPDGINEKGPFDTTPDLLGALGHIMAGEGKTPGSSTGGANGAGPNNHTTASDQGAVPKGDSENPYTPAEHATWSKHGGWYEDPTTVHWLDPILAEKKTNGEPTDGVAIYFDAHPQTDDMGTGIYISAETWHDWFGHLYEKAATMSKDVFEGAEVEPLQWGEYFNCDEKEPTDEEWSDLGEDYREAAVREHDEENMYDMLRAGGSGGEQDEPEIINLDEAGTTTNPDEPTEPVTEADEAEVKEKILKATGIAITWVDGFDFNEIEVPEDLEEAIKLLVGDDSPMDPDLEYDGHVDGGISFSPMDPFDPLINPGNPDDEVLG